LKNEYVVAVEAKPESSDIATVVRSLTEYNAAETGGDVPNYLLVSLRDKEGKLAGGLFGATYLGWLQVQALWVTGELRGGGYGKAMLDAAEQEAVRRGCPRVFLETLSFQALPFYEKCGYKVFSTLPDFPIGGARYALTKQLAAG
jgi:GNAT superfamily N-acetyltransferase